MLLESVEVGASGIAKIAAGGLSFFVRLEFWEGRGRELDRIAKGLELDEEEAIDLLVAAKATEAEARGASLLGHAEQPRFVLRYKLIERGYPEIAVDMALDRLEQEGFLSDARYAEAWLRARVDRAIRSGAGRGGSRPEGPASLLRSIRARGVDETRAKTALALVLDADARQSLLGAAYALLSRASRGSPGEGRSDIRGALRGLGWKGEEIRELLDE